MHHHAPVGYGGGHANGAMAEEFSQQAYGAHFAEVAVSYGVSGVTGLSGLSQQESWF